MSLLGDIFGDKPEVAPYIPTEFGPEQIKALKENIAAFPWISQLGDIFQSYMTDAFNTAIPGFSDILKMGGKLTQQMESTAGEYLSGKIPQDVQEAVQRSSAFQNLQSGGGGAMAQANTARNFGLTSMDLISKGAQLEQSAGNAAQRWAGLASNLIMNPAGYLVTPAQQVQLTMSNRLHEQATQQLRNNVNAAPDPALQALNQWVQQVGGTVVASYLGGGAGGKGGGNYKTSYNASDYLGGPGPSDVSNPGYINPGVGGGSLYMTGGAPPAPSSWSQPTSLWGSYQPPPSTDLWSSYQPGAAMGFGTGQASATGNDLLSLNSPTGTTDFLNIPTNENMTANLAPNAFGY